MRKSVSLIISTLIVLGFMAKFDAIGATTYNITPKTPTMSSSLKPIVLKYKNQDYIGAMQDLEDLIKVEKNNTFARYYLALCYTRLGYKDEAKLLYKEVVKKDENIALSYYSQKALDCLESPDTDACRAHGGIKETSGKSKTSKIDDITVFIESGDKIHPSAMDRITNERMVRKLEQEEYQKRQQEAQAQRGELKSDASRPSNDEIVAAINTLQKIGINPYGANQFNPLAQAQQFNQYGLVNNPAFFTMDYGQNSNLASMYLYNQMVQQNNLLNYGM